MLAIACAGAAQSQDLRLRALLATPVTDRDARVVDLGLRGEARVTVHEDGQARLDLVSWALPAGPVDVVLRLDAAGGRAPLLVLPLERDADEGRVLGAEFRLDAAAARRLRAGDGQVVLTSERLPVAIGHGALRLHPRRSTVRQAAD